MLLKLAILSLDKAGNLVREQHEENGQTLDLVVLLRERSRLALMVLLPWVPAHPTWEGQSLTMGRAVPCRGATETHGTETLAQKHSSHTSSSSQLLMADKTNAIGESQVFVKVRSL